MTETLQVACVAKEIMAPMNPIKMEVHLVGVVMQNNTSTHPLIISSILRENAKYRREGSTIYDHNTHLN